MDKELTEYRVHLIEAGQKAQEDFDKTVLMLAGGALAVSFAFVKDLIGPGPISSKALLVLSWVCWSGSLTAVLLSYYASYLTLRKAIKQIDAGERPPNPGGRLRLLTLVLNALGGLLFLTGVVLMIVFVWFNLEAINVRSK